MSYTKCDQKFLEAQRKKKHLGWKGRNKTVFIHRWHDCLGRKSDGICQKMLLELVSELSKFAGYKINSLKIVFLFTSNE